MFSLTSFCRKASQDYFRASSTGNGHRYLIAKALGQEKSMSNLDGDDIDMMMSVSHFVTTLTWNQRALLAEVLSKTTEATRRQYEMEMQTKLTGKAPS
jgi:citrate lyase synthetase